MGASIVHTIDGEYIREWLVLGPFFPNELDRDLLTDAGGEANIQPCEGMSLTTPDRGSYTWKRYKAEFDLINLQDAMKQLLFSADLRFQSELDDSGQPSDELRQVFADSGFPLSEKATIVTDNEGSRWWVVDKDNQQDYVVLKEDEKLNIYSEPRDAVGYVACNILSPEDQHLEMVLERFYGVKVWVNGSLIHRTPEFNRWDTERFEIPLKEGENLCLIKVGQYMAGVELQWGFSVRVQDHDAYLRSLELKLNVRRKNLDGGDELTISVRREPGGRYNWELDPQSAIWKLPSVSVEIQIRDETQQTLATLQSCEGEPVLWTVPAKVQGSIGIIARLTDISEKTYEARFTCQAHSIIPVAPQVGHWETISVADGLGGPKIWAMLQDRNGVLWFGLQPGGVCRYDGRTFRTFTTRDGLPSNYICSMFEDSRGHLWFGTMDQSTMRGSGVCRYDGKTFQTFTEADGLAGSAITAIYEDNRGHLWFGSSWLGVGVSRFDGKTFHRYTKEDGFPSGYGHMEVAAITQDQAGNLWFAHGIKGWLAGYGVTRYDGNAFRNFRTEDGLAHDRVMSIAEDKEGNLWFGTGGGVSFYDGKTFQNFTTVEGLVSNWVLDVLQTRNGDIWFATFGGVSQYRDGRFHSFTTEDGLVNNHVWSIVEDREGDLWFGTVDGVSRYDRSVKSIPMSVGDAIRDRKGNLWFHAPGTGLGQYDGQNIRTFAEEDGLHNRSINRIHEDNQGNIWFGGVSAGLTKYDGKRFQTFTGKDGLSMLNFWDIWEDRDGLLWIGMGASGGVCTYGGTEFVKVVGKKQLGVGHQTVRCIIRDKNGNMWFSRPGYGICRYDGKSFTKFNTTNGLPSNTSDSLLGDRQGNVWIGTHDGLCCYDGKTFRTYTTDDGLAGNQINSLFEDSRENLWIGMSGGGIHKFDGRNFQIFTTDDGLMSNSGKTLEDEEGKMIFVTSKGITIYTPPVESIPPPIAITEVVADKVYPAPKRLTIPSTIPRIGFFYYGMSFKTRRMRYNYMLEGFDTDWQATWDEQVNYENLEQGNYVFKVIAIDRDLNYSEPASVELEVIPDPRNHRIIQLEEHIREQELAELERVHKELEDARQIQLSLLPKEAPAVEGFQIAGTSLPAKEVSGDFFTYLPLGENTGIVLADVTGKSVKAAMVAALADGMLSEATKSRRELWDSPAMILSELNTGLHPRLMRGMFTAMSLSIIKPEQKRLAFSNAGMLYPIVKRGSKVWELEVTGMPLGLMDRAEYEDLNLDLEGGDFVVFHSDGVIEAENEAEEMYQTERLLELIQQADPGMSAQEMVELILKDVTAFVGGEEASDDITIVALKSLSEDCA